MYNTNIYLKESQFIYIASYNIGKNLQFAKRMLSI